MHRQAKDEPAAVLYTVLASLFVAYTVIPFLASRMLRAEGEAGVSALVRDS